MQRFTSPQHRAPCFSTTTKEKLIRVRLSPEGYEELSRTLPLVPDYAFGGRKLNWSPPAYANANVCVTNQHEFVCASLGQ